MVTRGDQIEIFAAKDLGLSASQDAPSLTKARDFGLTPTLDSVRGVAVILVMLYHLGIFFNGFTPVVIGGFRGVDIFFVLSGFLITAVLVREYDKIGQISLRNFYLRRIYRLVPAYWFFLFVLIAFGWLLLPPTQVTELYSGQKFFFALTYLTNWNSAYGVTAGNLNHTWSLSIEEQFYLFWPLALTLGFSRKVGPKWIVFITLFTVALLTWLRVARLESGTPFSVLYYSTESRIDSLLIGCITGLVFMYRLVADEVLRSRTFLVVAGTSAATIVWIISWLSEKDPEAFRIYLSLFSVCTAIVILWLVTNTNPGGPFQWFFGNKYLQWIGRISYGLYLWHYLAFEISRRIFDALIMQIAFGIVLAFVVAASSFYLLEQKFLLKKKRLEVA